MNVQGINIRQRWVFAVMCFFGVLQGYAIRTCLPITMTEMVVPIESEVYLDDSCPADFMVESNTTNSGNYGGKYNWTEYTQGTILASFYYGYLITHVPGGLLSAKYGGKQTLGLGIFIASICTLLIPLAVIHADNIGLIVLRILVGLGEGVLYPAVSTMLSQWVPPEERSRIVAFVYSGEIFGTIYANSAGGTILHYFGNWSSVFYLIGGTGVVWYILWLVLCYNNPKEHPFISQQEVDYLDEKMSEHRHDKPEPVPWIHVFKSKPVWAIVIAFFGFDWSLITILTYLPKYMSSVLKFSVEKNGYLNSVVCVCMWFGSIIASWFADMIVERQYVSRTIARKIGGIVSLFGSSCFVVAASYAGCDQILVTFLFAISMFLLASCYSSIVVNILDISPNYAGTLMAIANAISCGLAGSISPYLISILAPDQTLGQWRLVFWLLFTVSTTTTALYLYLGNAEVEYWNDRKILANVVLTNEGKIKGESKVTISVISNSDV